MKDVVSNQSSLYKIKAMPEVVFLIIAGYEVDPSMTKNTASGFFLWSLKG
jgi:hypothetical protein